MCDCSGVDVLRWPARLLGPAGHSGTARREQLAWTPHAVASNDVADACSTGR